MVPTLVSIGLEILKGAPEIIDMLHQMKQNGQTEPTEEQKNELTAALQARGVADAEWASFKAG